MKLKSALWTALCGGLVITGVIVLGRALRNTAEPNQSRQPGQTLNYRILQDNRGKILQIGVACPIDEKSLRATLIKAADDHQADAARDYFMSKYFYVRAYLVYKDRQSSIPAGLIERYVPPRNPEIKEEPSSDADKEDVFEIRISEALESLRAQVSEACQP